MLDISRVLRYHLYPDKQVHVDISNGLLAISNYSIRNVGLRDHSTF